MKFKLISLILLFGLTAGILSSCFGDNSENDEKLNLEVTLGDAVFKADTLNNEASGEKIAVYTRDYKDKDGNILLKINQPHTDRAVFGIKYSNNKNGVKYTVVSEDTSGNDKSDTPIPINGFAISIPLSLVKDLHIKVNHTAEVTGFEEIAPEYERLDLGAFIPKNRALARRVSYINPVDGISEQKCIYLVTNDYGKDIELPEGSVAFLMRLVASDNYRINSIQENGTVSAGTNALIFIGDYNALYAKTFFNEEDKLYISRKDKISPYSDTSAVLIGETVYKIGDEKTNLSSITESGIYFYNSYFDLLVTPARELDFYDIVIVDDIVAYKGEKNKRIMIPSNAGVVVSFVGENISIAENLEVGDKVSALLVDTKTLPDMYLSANGSNIEILTYNTVRNEENSCVVFSTDYGKTTGTDSEGIELIISGDKITSVEKEKGSAAIPEDGYVVSIHNSNTSYRSAESIAEGTNCILSLADSVYSLSTLEYDDVNTVRGEDKMIVYKNKKNTGTNPYGYEIIVNSDGMVVGDSSAGNSDIPENGYVISGHGKAEEELESLYSNGAKAILDEENNKITIIKTPMLKIDNAASAYNYVVKQFEKAKKEFYDIDYKTVGEKLDELSKMMEKAEQAVNDCNYSDAIRLSLTVSDRLDKLEFSMIRSSAVENRAAWYRSNDKNDSEVEAAIKKADDLNINTIYLETWYNGMVTGYSDNELVKHHTNANGDFDALEAFCRIGHEYGIEIHAWVENFFIGTLPSSMEADTLVNKTYGKHLLDIQGNNYNRTCFGDYVFLNPYDKNNRAFILGIYEELITKYDLDGLHLDYIRFPEYNFQAYDYGYNDDIIKGFQDEYNTSVDPKTLSRDSEMYDNWCKFRENIINSWVEEVYNLVKQTKPELWISCACYPDAKNVPKTLYQNFSNWLENGWIDEVFSMSYSADNDFVKNNAELFESMVGDKAFYSTGLSAFGTTTANNFAKQIDIVRDIDADGSAIFSLGSITPDNYTNAMAKGSYRVKAVQTYKLSKTISAGMSDILRKLDNVYGFDRNNKFESKIKPLIKDIKNEADAFDLDNASINQKINYTKEAIKDLQNIISVINSVDIDSNDNVMRNALIKDFEKLIKHMTQSQNRLNARKA